MVDISDPSPPTGESDSGSLRASEACGVSSILTSPTNIVKCQGKIYDHKYCDKPFGFCAYDPTGVLHSGWIIKHCEQPPLDGFLFCKGHEEVNALLVEWQTRQS